MAGRKIHAGGKVYTPEEFVCEWCKTPLVLDTYYTIEGKNVCQSCRNKERCAVCGFLITESRYVTVDDKVYHPDCFRCSECLLELQKFHVVEGKLFCGDCLLLQAAERDPDSCCAKCFLPLSGSVLKALGNRYHEDCFVCHCCFKPFPNDEFVNIKGNPYCDECVNNENYLRSTAHLKAIGQTGAGHGGSGSGHGAGGDRGLSSGAGGYGAGSPAHGSGGPGGYGAGGPGGAGGYGAGGPGGAGGYGSGSPAHGAGGPGGAGGYGAGGPGGAGGYGSGGPGSGGYSSSRGLDDGGAGSGAGGYGAGGPGGASGYGAGAPGGAGGYGSGGPGAGGPGGAGGSGPGGAGGSGPEIRHRSAPEEDETVYAVNKYLDPSGLPPKGPSKYDSKFKAKLGGGMTEEKTKRDYKSKPALGYQNDSEHLKDLESLGYKTIRKK